MLAIISEKKWQKLAQLTICGKVISGWFAFSRTAFCIITYSLVSVANLAILSLDLESFWGFLATKFVPSY